MNAEQMWNSAVDVAQDMLREKQIKEALQPTVNMILSDPYAAALEIFKLMAENKKLEKRCAELGWQVSPEGMGQ